MSPRGAPLPVYKGVEEGEGRPSLWRALGGVLLPPGVGSPPFQVVRVGVKERGLRPPLLVQLGLLWEGAHHLLAASLSLPSSPTKAQYFPGGFR